MPLAINLMLNLLRHTPPFAWRAPDGDDDAPQGFGPAPASATDRLAPLDAPGSNPGELRGLVHVPRGLAMNSALVVILHGCKQTSERYDHGSGWSQLADELGFAVLYPQQQRINNLNLCFNWFDAQDAARGSGEAESILQMIAAMVDAHGIDQRRIFITGLSAGGAMASIMLAAYPELFAGGAIIAGLPFGSADGVTDAFDHMRGDGYPSDAELGSLVKDASAHDGPWPTVSVWHGSADSVVNPSNAERIIGQWLMVHGLPDAIADEDMVSGVTRRIWRDANGRELITSYDIAGMGHGLPLDTAGIDAIGASGPYMLEAGISSTRHIARAWGLLPTTEDALTPPG